MKNLKLKSYGKWNLSLAVINAVVAVVCWNPFAIINVVLAGYLAYDAFEVKQDANG